VEAEEGRAGFAETTPIKPIEQSDEIKTDSSSETISYEDESADELNSTRISTEQENS